MTPPPVPRPSLGQSVTLSASDLPIALFARILAEDYFLSLGWSRELDGAVVSVQVFEVTLDALLENVARRLGVELVESGGVYYLGQVKPSDELQFVHRVRGRDGLKLKTSLQAVLPPGVRAEVFEDGVCIVAGPADLVRGMGELLRRLDAVAPDNLVIQFYVVETYDEGSLAVGLEGRPEVKISADLASGALGLVATGEHAVLLDVVTSTGQVINTALVTAADGVTGSAERVERIPVPQRAITESGVIQTTGFTEVSIGSTFEATPAAGRLRYRVNLGEVIGYVEEQPRESAVTFDGDVAVSDGGLYLLGVMSRQVQSAGFSSALWAAKRERRESSRRVLLWALVSRVAGSVLEDEA